MKIEFKNCEFRNQQITKSGKGWFINLETSEGVPFRCFSKECLNLKKGDLVDLSLTCKDDTMFMVLQVDSEC